MSRRWMLSGACVGKDTDLFFPKAGGRPTAAQKICATCPVVLECDEWIEDVEANLRTPGHGVFAAKTARQRWRDRRDRKRGLAA